DVVMLVQEVSRPIERRLSIGERDVTHPGYCADVRKKCISVQKRAERGQLRNVACEYLSFVRKPEGTETAFKSYFARGDHVGVDLAPLLGAHAHPLLLSHL